MYSPLKSFLYLKCLELKDSLRKKILEKAAHIKSRAKTRNKNSREENVASLARRFMNATFFAFKVFPDNGG